MILHGGREKRGKISLTQSFVSQNPAPSSEGAFRIVASSLNVPPSLRGRQCRPWQSVPLRNLLTATGLTTLVVTLVNGCHCETSPQTGCGNPFLFGYLHIVSFKACVSMRENPLSSAARLMRCRKLAETPHPPFA